MRTEKFYFPHHHQAVCVFPDERSNLAQAIAELGLKGRYPVIVLIGGKIDEQQAEVTQRAIQSICKIAAEIKAVVLCGGTDMGVMAEIGRIRSRESYKFPLVGITPEELVTWPGGPHSTKFYGGERNAGSWRLITPISSLYPAASLGMSLPGLSMLRLYYRKIISL